MLFLFLGSSLSVAGVTSSSSLSGFAPITSLFTHLTSLKMISHVISMFFLHLTSVQLTSKARVGNEVEFDVEFFFGFINCLH